MTVFAIAALVLAFGHIAEEVIEGDATKFDQTILLFFRSFNDLSDPIGPPWVEEMARDITALGSYAVLSVVVCAVIIYLFMAGQRASAFWIFTAVVGGVLLSNALKLVSSVHGQTSWLTPPASSPLASRVDMRPYRPSLI